MLRSGIPHDSQVPILHPLSFGAWHGANLVAASVQEAISATSMRHQDSFGLLKYCP